MNGRSNVITATEMTSGDVNEAHEMIALLENHRFNTGIQAGTVENFLACNDQGVEAHMPDLKEWTEK
jgi:hypothetical protein